MMKHGTKEVTNMEEHMLALKIGLTMMEGKPLPSCREIEDAIIQQLGDIIEAITVVELIK